MIGCSIRRFERCASTSDEAANWARDKYDPAPHGGVILADSQTGGRGRLGRQWHSPPGQNLYFSCVLRPELPIHKVPPITLCAGLAVCEIVNSLGVAASIKWPNDVLVGGRKLAGVLTEMSTQAQKLEAVIVGVGINVNSIEFPPELSATSLRLESGAEHDRALLLGNVLRSMDHWVERYCSEGVAGLAQAFAEHSMLRGKEVRARVSGVLIVGRVASLGEDGSLEIIDAAGTVHRVIAGEVELVTAAHSPLDTDN